MAVTDSPFDERELRAWDLIVETMGAINDMDERRSLTYNGEELAETIHVLQSFVKQHLCWRCWPNEFSDWWSEPHGD